MAEGYEAEIAAQEVFATEAVNDLAKKLGREGDERFRKIMIAKFKEGMGDYYAGEELKESGDNQQAKKTATTETAHQEVSTEVNPEDKIEEKPIREMSEEELLTEHNNEDKWIFLEGRLIAIPVLDDPKYAPGYYIIPDTYVRGRFDKSICPLIKVLYDLEDEVSGTYDLDLTHAKVIKAAFMSKDEYDKKGNYATSTSKSSENTLHYLAAKLGTRKGVMEGWTIE
ncbi:hypothetical protein KJ903_02655 [Patescibacteria group bacterium]|nr:hypothetical protein [Patescibacteria group bacterium]